MQWTDLVTVLVAAFFALGFEAIVRASPLGKIRMKPFNCRTCLAGWGAILGAEIFVLYIAEDCTAHGLCRFVLYAGAGLGVAKIIQRAQPLTQPLRREREDEFPPVDP